MCPGVKEHVSFVPRPGFQLKDTDKNDGCTRVSNYQGSSQL